MQMRAATVAKAGLGYSMISNLIICVVGWILIGDIIIWVMNVNEQYGTSTLLVNVAEGVRISEDPLQSVRPSSNGTMVGFYDSSCPQAEAIIQKVVQDRFASDDTITPALLRLFFHDCFINGCDASILIDSTPNNTAEKDAGPNKSVRGFDLIDEAKAAVEAACPGIVSCADIIALSVRDGIVLAGGPSYPVACGRKDGLVSKDTDASGSLPSPSFSVDQVRVSFEARGLTLSDMVVLLGAHTVGTALCGFFSDRVFSFRGTGGPDPSMNATLARSLASLCPNPFSSESSADPPVALDQGTPHLFDTSFYAQIRQGNAILQIDQELVDDPRTAAMVAALTNRRLFFPSFVRSITLMGSLVSTTAPPGDVRANCRRFNGHGSTNNNNSSTSNNHPSPSPSPSPSPPLTSPSPSASASPSASPPLTHPSPSPPPLPSPSPSPSPLIPPPSSPPSPTPSPPSPLPPSPTHSPSPSPTSPPRKNTLATTQQHHHHHHHHHHHRHRHHLITIP